MGNHPMKIPAAPFLGPARPEYHAVHYHLRLVWGAARNYRCPCGFPAKKWAYDNEDPHELTTLQNRCVVRFSANLVHYNPLCNVCHYAQDEARRQAEGYWA